MVNCICSAAFCESVALRESTASLRPHPALPAKAQSLQARLLPGGGAVAQRLRGYKSAEPEKTVKRSSRRTGVNLQFFPV